MFFEVTSVTSGELTSNEISEMTAAVVDSFDVDASDVNTEVAYVSTGSLEINVDVETSEDEVIDAVTTSLSDLLGVHPSDVTIVSVDLASGEVIYEIASEINMR